MGCSSWNRVDIIRIDTIDPYMGGDSPRTTAASYSITYTAAAAAASPSAIATTAAYSTTSSAASAMWANILVSNIVGLYNVKWGIIKYWPLRFYLSKNYC